MSKVTTRSSRQCLVKEREGPGHVTRPGWKKTKLNTLSLHDALPISQRRIPFLNVIGHLCNIIIP